MDDRSVRLRAIGIAILITFLSVLSTLFGAGVFGLLTFDFMGLYVFLIYVFTKWYIFFPVMIVFYTLARVSWKRTTMSRRRYCLVWSIGAAILFSIVGVILLRELNPLGILGTFTGGFVPVMLSTYTMSEDFFN